ncbi:MAG: anthranilate phosphoribosyltransferase, partial [Verrucomicrobiota bacterium]
MSVLKDLTVQLYKGCDLSPVATGAAVAALLDLTVADDAKANFLTGLAQKGETAAEIA